MSLSLIEQFTQKTSLSIDWASLTTKNGKKDEEVEYLQRVNLQFSFSLLQSGWSAGLYVSITPTTI